jgi:hypothetical protein
MPSCAPVEDLLHSKPIVPKHEAPEDLVGSMVFDDDQQFFADFREFGEIVNRSLVHNDSYKRSWRLPELPDTQLRHRGGVGSGVFNLDSPGVRAPGRRPRHEQGYHEA